MNLLPISQGRFDFNLPSSELIQTIKDTQRQFKSQSHPKGSLCLETFRASLSKGEFLMPLCVGWEKPAQTLEKQKELRRALKNAAMLGINCKIDHPLSPTMKQQFRAFYEQTMTEKGYEVMLKDEYFSRNKLENLYLLYIENAEGKFCGGELVSRISKQKLSIHYKAVEQNKAGYDLLLENQLHQLALKEKVKLLGYGKDLNLRGIDGRKSTLLYYKLRFGYRPYFAPSLPVAYINLNSITERDFEYLIFISFKNQSGISSFKKLKPIFNIILGSAKLESLTDEINYLQREYALHLYDRYFQRITPTQSTNK